MIVILTPYYKAREVTQRMCEAIDANTINPYHHILIDDNSDNLLDIPTTRNRSILAIRNDVPGKIHKNQLGQGVQLGVDFALQHFSREEPRTQDIDYVFLIESDVIVLEKGWDQKQIDLISELPSDWGTLDVQSVNEEGNITYPTTHSTRLGFVDDGLEIMEYPDFQCTLFNPRILDGRVKFSDFPSHFDILFGRKTTEVYGVKHYRTRKLKVLHVNGGGSSRDLLPKE